MNGTINFKNLKVRDEDSEVYLGYTESAKLFNQCKQILQNMILFTLQIHFNDTHYEHWIQST